MKQKLVKLIDGISFHQRSLIEDNQFRSTSRIEHLKNLSVLSCFVNLPTLLISQIYLLKKLYLDLALKGELSLPPIVSGYCFK
ncbi:hypothetical protein [cyanobacterium endosymbiont of Rhopalodia gibberula]|uniref:hypothetical protein n=1 Tax=cyanobacterium endosymbiont of Rhopalodia gibberula TaxID=1763363 RepID=UPI000E65E5CC|nr:hypothetical protein [cyanobacterium endosymbiont of Rhopalodia gibberula]